MTSLWNLPRHCCVIVVAVIATALLYGCGPAIAGAASSIGGSESPPPPPPCEVNGTGTLDVRNTSPDATFSVLLDGMQIDTLSPGSSTMHVAFEGTRTVRFLYAGTATEACNTTLLLFKCDTKVVECDAKLCRLNGTASIVLRNSSNDATYDVFLDGQNVARLAPGESDRQEVLAGRHDARFVFAGTSTEACPTQSVTVAACETDTITCNVSACSVFGTAEYTFVNSSGCFIVDVLVDRSRKATLQPGQRYKATISAGQQHTLDWEFSGLVFCQRILTPAACASWTESCGNNYYRLTQVNNSSVMVTVVLTPPQGSAFSLFTVPPFSQRTGLVQTGQYVVTAPPVCTLSSLVTLSNCGSGTFTCK